MVAALAQMVAALAQIVVRLAQMVVRLAHRNDPLPLVPDASENEMTLRKQPVLLPFHAQRALIFRYEEWQSVVNCYRRGHN